MEKLIEQSIAIVKSTRLNFKRYLFDSINWSNRLIAIRGARGVGKTTLLLQHFKEKYKPGRESLYVSLDNLYFSTHSLFDFADEFVKNGGKHLYLDEVHKYPNWSQELKNMYDLFPELKIVFSGSSLLQVYQGNADLSRRLVSYDLHGLSFREFVAFDKNISLPVFRLDDITRKHQEIAYDISSSIKPLAEFRKYLEYGYYPFYKESLADYHHKIRNVINLILETDLPATISIDYSSILKVKKLLAILAVSVPFTPNIVKLSERTGATRKSIIKYFDYLSRAGILNLLTSEAKGLKYLAKPDKIYLTNSNLMYALAGHADTGSARETFFLSQLKVENDVTSAPKGDFQVDGKYLFEIGGKSKSFHQIKNESNSFLVIDQVEAGSQNKIPLWMFGLLY